MMFSFEHIDISLAVHAVPYVGWHRRSGAALLVLPLARQCLTGKWSYYARWQPQQGNFFS